MPLPAFPANQSTWIEVTKADHDHGGPGWEFGTCLWSPSKSKPEEGRLSGRDIYRPMREVNVNDLILHFYENRWDGRASPEFRLCGYSRAATTVSEISREPPKAGIWAGRDSYYRIELTGFAELERTLSVAGFLAEQATSIKAEKINAGLAYYPFSMRKDGLRLAQGTYLARCTSQLYTLLKASLGEENAHGGVVASVGQQEAFVEGTRRKQEAYFFSRNPALVREAKRRYGSKCMVCGFDFEEIYGALGKGYIECHHLNPLSEREDYPNERITRVEEVAVVCANCHRMLHRTSPALTLSALRTLLRSSSASVPADAFQSITKLTSPFL